MEDTLQADIQSSDNKKAGPFSDPAFFIGM